MTTRVVMPVTSSIEQLMELVEIILAGAAPLRLGNETELQADVDAALTAYGPPIQTRREATIGPGCRIDHLVTQDNWGTTLGIEDKLRGSPAAIAAQVKRYIENPAIDGLLLITQRSIAMPDTYRGKPLRSFRPSGRGGLF